MTAWSSQSVFPGARFWRWMMVCAWLSTTAAPSRAAQLPPDNPLPPPVEELPPAQPEHEAATPQVDEADAQPAPADVPPVQPGTQEAGVPVDAEGPGWSAPAVAAASGFAVLALAQWASVLVTALVCGPLLAIAMASSREGNPWFTVPPLATGLPLLLGGLVFATAVGAAGGLALAYVVAAGAVGWRFALAPVFTWWAGVALGALVPVGLLALVWSGLVVAVTSAGTLVYAAYLEEANGLRPLDADAQAKRQAAPALFVVGLGLGAVVLGAALAASQAGAAAVLLVTARRWGMEGTLTDEVMVLPREKKPPG